MVKNNYPNYLGFGICEWSFTPVDETRFPITCPKWPPQNPQKHPTPRVPEKLLLTNICTHPTYFIEHSQDTNALSPPLGFLRMETSSRPPLPTRPSVFGPPQISPSKLNSSVMKKASPTFPSRLTRDTSAPPPMTGPSAFGMWRRKPLLRRFQDTPTMYSVHVSIRSPT